jgi:hypothetical protein
MSLNPNSATSGTNPSSPQDAVLAAQYAITQTLANMGAGSSKSFYA